MVGNLFQRSRVRNKEWRRKESFLAHVNNKNQDAEI